MNELKSNAMGGGTYSLLAEASSLVAWTADLLLRQSAAGFAIKFHGNECAAAAAATGKMAREFWG